MVISTLVEDVERERLPKPSFLSEVDALYRHAEQAVREYRTFAHYNQSPSLDELCPDTFGDCDLPLIASIANQYTTRYKNGSLTGAAQVPAEALIWRQEAYTPTREAIDAEVETLQERLENLLATELETAKARLNAKVRTHTLFDSDIFAIIPQFELGPQMQGLREALYTQSGLATRDSPLFLYELCFRELARERGWSDPEKTDDTNLLTQLEEAAVPLELFTKYVGRQVKLPSKPATITFSGNTLHNPGSSMLQQIPANPVIFSYTHEDQATQEALTELIRRLREDFPNTPAAIAAIGSGEVQRGHIVLSAALTTILSQHPDLARELGYPITPLQSEQLLQGRRRPKEPSEYWEDLGLVLYSREGANGACASALADEVTRNRDVLNLTPDQLRQPLLIARSGLRIDDEIGYRFTIIPGVTQVSTPEVLQTLRGDHRFREYRLDHGLPRAKDIDADNSNRYLWMPSSSNANGLRTLCRRRDLYLDARNEDLSSSVRLGRVTLSGR